MPLNLVQTTVLDALYTYADKRISSHTKKVSGDLLPELAGLIKAAKGLATLDQKTVTNIVKQVKTIKDKTSRGWSGGETNKILTPLITLLPEVMSFSEIIALIDDVTKGKAKKIDAERRLADVLAEAIEAAKTGAAASVSRGVPAPAADAPRSVAAFVHPHAAAALSPPLSSPGARIAWGPLGEDSSDEEVFEEESSAGGAGDSGEDEDVRLTHPLLEGIYKECYTYIEENSPGGIDKSALALRVHAVLCNYEATSDFSKMDKVTIECEGWRKIHAVLTVIDPDRSILTSLIEFVEKMQDAADPTRTLRAEAEETRKALARERARAAAAEASATGAKEDAARHAAELAKLQAALEQAQAAEKLAREAAAAAAKTSVAAPAAAPSRPALPGGLAAALTARKPPAEASAPAPVKLAAAAKLTPAEELKKRLRELAPAVATENGTTKEEIQTLFDSRLATISTRYPDLVAAIIPWLNSLDDESVQKAIKKLSLPLRAHQQPAAFATFMDDESYTKLAVVEVKAEAAPASEPIKLDSLAALKARFEKLAHVVAEENAGGVSTLIPDLFKESLDLLNTRLTTVLDKYVGQKEAVLTWFNSLDDESLQKALRVLTQPARPGVNNSFEALQTSAAYTKLPVAEDKPAVEAAPAPAAPVPAKPAATGGSFLGALTRRAQEKATGAATNPSAASTTVAPTIDPKIMAETEEFKAKVQSNLQSMPTRDPATDFEYLPPETVTIRLSQLEQLLEQYVQYATDTETDAIKKPLVGAKIKHKVLLFLQTLDLDSLERAINDLANNAAFTAEETSEIAALTEKAKAGEAADPAQKEKRIKLEKLKELEKILNRKEYTTPNPPPQQEGESKKTYEARIHPWTLQRRINRLSKTRGAAGEVTVTSPTTPGKPTIKDKPVIVCLPPLLAADIGIPESIKRVLKPTQDAIIRIQTELKKPSTKLAPPLELEKRLEQQQQELHIFFSLFCLQSIDIIRQILSRFSIGDKLGIVCSEFRPKVSTTEYLILVKYSEEHPEISSQALFNELSKLDDAALHTRIASMCSTAATASEISPPGTASSSEPATKPSIPATAPSVRKPAPPAAVPPSACAHPSGVLFGGAGDVAQPPDADAAAAATKASTAAEGTTPFAALNLSVRHGATKPPTTLLVDLRETVKYSPHSLGT